MVQLHIPVSIDFRGGNRLIGRSRVVGERARIGRSLFTPPTSVLHFPPRCRDVFTPVVPVTSSGASFFHFCFVRPVLVLFASEVGEPAWIYNVLGPSPCGSPVRARFFPFSGLQELPLQGGNWGAGSPLLPAGLAFPRFFRFGCSVDSGHFRAKTTHGLLAFSV